MNATQGLWPYRSISRQLFNDHSNPKNSNFEKRVIIVENHYMRGLVRPIVEWTRNFSRFNMFTSGVMPRQAANSTAGHMACSNNMEKGHLGNLEPQIVKIFHLSSIEKLFEGAKNKVPKSGMNPRPQKEGNFWRILKISGLKGAIKNVSEDSSLFH